jgi:hypothetical protein
MWHGDVCCIHVVKNRFQWRALVNTVMNLRVPRKRGGKKRQTIRPIKTLTAGEKIFEVLIAVVMTVATSLDTTLCSPCYPTFRRHPFSSGLTSQLDYYLPSNYTCILKPALAHSYSELTSHWFGQWVRQEQRTNESMRNPFPSTLQRYPGWLAYCLATSYTIFSDFRPWRWSW